MVAAALFVILDVAKEHCPAAILHWPGADHRREGDDGVAEHCSCGVFSVVLRKARRFF